MKEPLLNIENLTVSFDMYDRGFEKKRLEVIHSLSLQVYDGEILAVVGASGSGKSLLANAVLGILPGNSQVSGEMIYDGIMLDADRQKKLR